MARGSTSAGPPATAACCSWCSAMPASRRWSACSAPGCSARIPNLRLLVLSAEAGLATKMTRNVRRVLERNPADPPSPAAGAARSGRRPSSPSRATPTHRDPSLLARGIGANITGCRADIVICDDVEVPEHRRAPSDKRHGAARAPARGLASSWCPDGTQLYIGTPHSYYSIYADEPRPELDEAVPFLAELHPPEHSPGRPGAVRRLAGPVRRRRRSADCSATAARTASAAR